MSLLVLLHKLRNQNYTFNINGFSMDQSETPIVVFIPIAHFLEEFVVICGVIGEYCL